MDPETLKLFANLGGVGILAVVAIWRIEQARKDQREDMREIRDALEKVGDWNEAIHSRLGSLGSDSTPPPTRRSRGERIRMRTAPSGVPVTIDPEQSSRHRPKGGI